jgi:hypothetical protein
MDYLCYVASMQGGSIPAPATKLNGRKSVIIKGFNPLLGLGPFFVSVCAVAIVLEGSDTR